MLITSRTNPRVAAIRRLRSRREREATGFFLAEGIRIVAEAVVTGADIETLVVAPDLLRSPVGRDLVATRRAAGVPVLEVSPDVFESLSTKENPQGLAAVVRQRWLSLEEAAAREGGTGVGPAPGSGGGPAGASASGSCRPAADLPLWVALDAVADPGNLGTILRTSDAMGGRGVVLLGDTADPYDPTAVRASMGSLFAQALVRSTFDELVAWCQGQGLRLVGTSGASATACDTPAAQAVYGGPLVLLMGSERQGLSAERQAACDLVVSIPMSGRADSLNLAVATGMMLYEIQRRRRAYAS